MEDRLISGREALKMAIDLAYLGPDERHEDPPVQPQGVPFDVWAVQWLRERGLLEDDSKEGTQ